jgi:hypothetical protein
MNLSASHKMLNIYLATGEEKINILVVLNASDSGQYVCLP